ncbi:MAG: FGE-sulfatase protein, partial [Acidobacteria bacterium]|nr:FGE-sulfatase protein [Acidobacteriota bacterium]
ENEFGGIRDLDRLYVVPDLQDFNPPEEMNDPSLIVSRQSAFRLFDEFLHRLNLDEDGHRCLFILGDAGMGKTSLLLMLKFRHLTSFLPTSHDCVLMKLGRDTLDRVAAVEHPAGTILLLDSLDEDPEAHRSPNAAEGRLLELLPRLARFHRTVITCRTQFFPETSRHLTTRPGHFVISPYECPLKYVSLFTDEQVELYLRKRFRPAPARRLLRVVTGWRLDDPKLAEARAAARSMDSLRLRPLLLSYIDDFVGGEDSVSVDFANRYAVFHRLVDRWLMRDARKPLGMETAESWRVATLLALHLTRQGRKQISRDELAAIDALREIGRFKIEARSLINRTDNFQFQFAHATIQEFLLAHAILSDDPQFDLRGLQLSREAFRLLIHGQRFLGKKNLELRGAALGPGCEPIEWLRLIFGIELIPIQPGEFLMGSPEDEAGRFRSETRHRVRLNQAFWIGRYPVTQAEYEAVMGNNPSHFKGDRRPVEQVSWDEAVEFCARLTQRSREAGALPASFEFRLPTEAEWEYACRAGTTTAFNDGSNCTKPDGKDRALIRLGWHGEGAKGETHPVGEKAPNAWGLHDMHGNVWEWCVDYAEWQENELVTDRYVDGVIDPVSAKGAGRVVRGGSSWDFARICRSAYRFRFGPGYRLRHLGFRLAAGQPVGSGATGLEAGAEGRSPTARPDREA